MARELLDVARTLDALYNNGSLPLRFKGLYVFSKLFEPSLKFKGKIESVLVLVTDQGTEKHMEAAFTDEYTQLVTKCTKMSEELMEQVSDGCGALPSAYNDIASAIAKGNRLHEIWLDGVKVDQCVFSQRSRPSLSTWKGWPWEAEHVMKRLLLGKRSRYKTIAPEVLVIRAALQEGSYGVAAFGFLPNHAKLLWTPAGVEATIEHAAEPSMVLTPSTKTVSALRERSRTPPKNQSLKRKVMAFLSSGKSPLTLSGTVNLTLQQAKTPAEVLDLLEQFVSPCDLEIAVDKLSLSMKGRLRMYLAASLEATA